MTTTAPQPPRAHHTRTEVKKWTDEKTGREVRQLTDLPKGAGVSYFRFPRQIPGGSGASGGYVLAWGQHERGNIIALDPESGRHILVPVHANAWSGRLRESDGRLWWFDNEKRQVMAVDLPRGEPFVAGSWPTEVPGAVNDITCDGKTLIFVESEQDLEKHPIPTTKDVSTVWHFLNRPRRASMWACDLASGACRKIHETQDVCPIHIDCSPADPGLVRFCLDMYDAYGQRIWSIRTDGSDLKKIRPQEYRELVTHEFWWADPAYIGFTYQDRRKDETIQALPWAEYSPCPTKLGIADLSGRQVYLSDPLNCYHTHLFMSPDGKWVCGEGTETHSFAYAAAFSMKRTRVDMTALATIHTPYVAFRGQGVETGFSADGRWLLFNDTVPDGTRQVCAVKVEL